MPELPEVETIVRALQHGGRGGISILGQTISAAEVRWERTIAEPSAIEFSQKITGQSILSISRRAKFLVLTLDRDTLIFHLRMSGDLRVEPQRGSQDELTPIQTHDRLLLLFEAGQRLVFNDPRKFGRTWLVPDPQTVLGHLGPEPLDPLFTPQCLYAKLHASHRALKPLLLDQSFLAGLGNIYTDESLHLARLHPLTPANRLTQDQAQLLWASIRSVLEQGILRNGASIDWVYRGGDFQNHFRVYQRTGLPCYTCGTPIERREIGQRGSHFCPNCQKL